MSVHRNPANRSLEETLQALYDSEINVTITLCWDRGIHYALVLCTKPDDVKAEDSGYVANFAKLADALHKTALEQLPGSDYARKHNRDP